MSTSPVGGESEKLKKGGGSVVQGNGKQQLTRKFPLLIFVYTKNGWLVGLVQEGFAWGLGELSKIPWKGVEQKRGKGTQRF